jgi:large subunit ribosomal protein L10
MQTKIQKNELVSQVVKNIGDSKALVFADYAGVPVKELTKLRRELMQAGGRWQVMKKTLLNIALAESKIAVNGRDLSGQIGVAYSNDEVTAAKILANFIKTHKELPFSIQGGSLGVDALSTEQVVALSKLPSQDELRGQLVGTLQAPISSFVRVLGGNLTGLVRTLQAIGEQKA